MLSERSPTLLAATGITVLHLVSFTYGSLIFQRILRDAPFMNNAKFRCNSSPAQIA